MKSEKGITLISVTIYIIAMLIVVAVISVLTGYFYKNVEVTTSLDDINKQYINFLSYFAHEANANNNKITDSSLKNDGTTMKETYIVFATGNQYTFLRKNNSIYFNHIKIASNIDNCIFDVKDEKSVDITIKPINRKRKKNKIYF